MEPRDAVKRWEAPRPSPVAAAHLSTASTLLDLMWAGVASTLHRVRRGEGALLAINLSLIAQYGLDRTGALCEVLVSALAIGLMYAFNDLFDAPGDLNNPKKDRTLIATYLQHRDVALVAIAALSAGTVSLAAVFLGGRATAAVTAVMVVNVVYSIRLKGVPVVDVAWCGLWGALYAAIVTGSPSLLVLVGLMTAVCHLYQALGDRVTDAMNAVVTTAVRSSRLSHSVLFGLSVLLFVALRPPLGAAWALTALIPSALLLACRDAHTGWLLTKVYFGIVWLQVLERVHALG